MGKSMEAAENSVPIFVTTNVDTHLVISSSPSDTVATLKGKIRNGHLFCFPHFGDIEIGALMVEHKSLVYHLPDSIFVETVFHGSNGIRYLLAEVSGSDLCNQQEHRILSGKDGNLGILTKTENGEFHRHLDKKSNGTTLDVYNGKSKKKKKHKLVTEGLHVKEGHDNNNEGYTDFVAVIDGKVAMDDEFGKVPKNPGSGDKITDPKGGNKRKKREKWHDLNEDLAECILSPCKQKSKREQVTEEIVNNAHCSSACIVKNIEMDKNSPVGQLTVLKKVSTLDSLNNNGTENVLMAVEKCEQQNLNGNIHTNAGNDHVTGKELVTARKHETSKELSTRRKYETSSKIFNEQNSLNGTEKNGLQRKADDSAEFITEKKSKSKRKRSSKTILNDDQGIFCNDVNDPCQITKHGHLQEYINGKTEENSARECDIEKKSNHEIKMASKHGPGNNDHDLSSKYVDDEPQITNHTDFLEYKDCKPEEVVAKCPGAPNVCDKNLDAPNNTENHQPCIITKKKKMKHSRNDMTWVDAQERITTEKIPKNDITVNSSKGERDVSILDAGNKNRRNIPYENPIVNNGDYNAEEVKSSKKSPSKINRDRTTKIVERGVDELVAKGSHSEQNAGNLEHVPEKLGTTPTENDQNCNDKEIKSSKDSSSKVYQEKTFNIQKRGIEEGVLKCSGAPIVSDKNGQTNKDMSGSVKYLDVSNNTENHQPCNITRKKKMKHSRNDMTLVDAQERITKEKAKKDDIIVKSSKSERDVSILDAGNENRRDTPGENGRVKYLNASHSKNNASRDLEHITETIGTTSMVYNKDCNTEKVKSSKNNPSKINEERTTKVVERGMDGVVAKGSKSEQNARDKGKKQKDKLDTNDMSYVKKSPKENQGDARFTEMIQPENKKVASQKNIAESYGHNPKRTESSSTAGTNQSSEKKEDIDWITDNDWSQGSDELNGRKDNSVSCHSQKKIANDVYLDSQHAEGEHGIDCNPVKPQMVGRTHDGEVMNRATGINTISPKIKTVKKTKVDSHSKKKRISLFRSSSDVSIEGGSGSDSYMGSSSSERSASDSSDSYDLYVGSRDKISKIQSIKPQTHWEPSTSGARLSTAAGEKKDNGGNGSIHSKFVHLLAKKTGLDELFKIARNQQKPESQHFGGDFMADDSPTVDMVLETQESQMDPVLNVSHKR